MTLFLTIFTLFNLCAAGAAVGAVNQLSREGAETRWASKRLFLIARLATGPLALIALFASVAAWISAPEGAPLILIPIAWLLASGAVFAIVDFAEDGVFDFGRGAPPKNPSA